MVPKHYLADKLIFVALLENRIEIGLGYGTNQQVFYYDGLIPDTLLLFV